MIFQDEIPFEPSVMPFMIFIGVCAIFTGFVTIKILSKYISNKSTIIRNLFLGILNWFSAVFAFFIGLISWLVENDRGIIYRTSLPVAYSCIIIASFFFLLLTIEMLSIKGNRKLFMVLTFTAYMIFIIYRLISPENEWGIIPPIPIYRTINLIILIIANVVLYIYLARKINKLSKITNNPEKKRDLRFMSYFFALMLGCFVLMVISEVHLTLIEDPPLFGPFEYLAWVSGLLGIFCGYLSFTQPEWYKTRYTKTE